MCSWSHALAYVDEDDQTQANELGESLPAMIDLGGHEDVDEQDLVALYLRDIAHYPRLTAEDERALSVRIRVHHDAEAERMLTQSNLRLVVSVAKRYQAQGLSLLDLIQEGNIGLMKAVPRYDGSKGFRFSTYAVWWITQQITRAIWGSHGPMRIPSRVIDEHRRARREQAQVQAQAPADDPAPVPAPEAPAPWSNTSITGDLAMDHIYALPASEDEAPQQRAEQLELHEYILAALEQVSERDQQIITQLFGLGDTTPRKLDEVAHDHKLTSERVRQIKKAAFATVRSSPYAEKLAAYY